MLSRILFFAFMALWMSAPIPSGAQEIPGAAVGRWWHMPLVSEKLQLTKEQERQLDDLYYDNRRKLLDLRNNIERERLDLTALIEKEPLDEAEAKAQFKKVEAAQSNLNSERFRYFLEVRKILGAERFQRLETLHGALTGIREKLRRTFMENSDSGQREP